MKKIKCRVWDKIKKAFIPNDVYAITVTDSSDFGVMIKDWEEYKEGEYFYDQYQQLSLFTGLCDKNGKEIYEGDIMIGREQKEFGKQLIEGMYKIQWEDAGFVAISIDGKSDTWAFFFETNINSRPLTECEIIGNIFENPELLTP